MSIAAAGPEPIERRSREYPARPIVGVAGLVLHAGQVLLIRRGRPPLAGSWSLPGGALRTGERIVDGITREVFEETSLRVAAVRQIATLDRILHDAAGQVQFHYVLIDWLCHLVSGPHCPVAGGDAMDAVWAHPADLERFSLEPLALDLILKTFEQEGQQ